MRPILDESRRAVDDAFSLELGDPRSANAAGRKAVGILRELKARLAELLGGAEAVFFGDGDMANGMAVLSAGREALKEGRCRLVSSPVERSSVVEALRVLHREGARIDLMETDNHGRVLPGSLESLIESGTGLVVCVWAEGVSGVVQPVSEIAGMCRSAGAWLHCDACFAAGRIPVDLTAAGVDSAAVSSLQLGGPPGSAAVILRDHHPWPMNAVPEFTFSANIPSICGMVAAMETTLAEMDTGTRIVNTLREDILSGLDSRGPTYSIIGGGLERTLPGTALLRLNRLVDKLHLRMEDEGIVLPSHNSSRRLSFLRRTGRDITHPDRYLGFSIDTRNTGVDIAHFVRSLTDACGR
ncbi:MAG: aminotransferase class V-fold PLP-dependent enzyme [Candidatus Aegiribacteria sp.]